MKNQINSYTWRFKVTFKDKRVEILDGHGDNVGIAYKSVIEYLINANLYDEALYIKDYNN